MHLFASAMLSSHCLKGWRTLTYASGETKAHIHTAIEEGLLNSPDDK